MMRSGHTSLRQRFLALEEGGAAFDDDVPIYRHEQRRRRRRIRILTVACIALAVLCAACWGVVSYIVEATTRWLLLLHGGLCATPADAVLELGAPGWLASAMPSVVVFQNSTMWWPVEIARDGRMSSLEQSRRCGNKEQRRMRAAMVEVQFKRSFVTRARRTFRGTEAACVQKAMELLAGEEICVEQ